MEHIEEAGIHSGDSACTLPAMTLGRADLLRIRSSTEAIARGIGVRGLLNVQYALVADVLYVLEANPRASRTVPFVSKATAVPLAKAAARVMLGATIAQLRAQGMLPAVGDGATLPLDAPISVKEAVLPWNRFRTADGQGVESLLGPEMRSTGEVMGIDADFGAAFAKSQTAAYGSLPASGVAFVSVANRDKRAMVFPVKRLADLGFDILATEGTAEVLRRHGVRARIARKHSAGPGEDGEPTIVEQILAGDVDLIVNTPFGVGPRIDGYEIRTAAVTRGIPCITTVQGLAAAVQGIEASRRGEITVRSLQEHSAALNAARRGSSSNNGWRSDLLMVETPSVVGGGVARPCRLGRALLQNPGVAVGVGKEHKGVPRATPPVDERRALVVTYRGRVDAPLDELGAGRVDVADHQLQPLYRTRRRTDLRTQHHRARRAGRRQLHETHPVADRVVQIHGEAELFGVELLGPVDVRDRKRDDLELPVHDTPRR